MKPNDKAIDAARKVVIQRATHNLFNPSFLFGVIEVALDAAYAAQFQSEDYAGLVKELRAECRDWLTADCVEKAADALEAVLAERDALRKWKEDDSDAMRIFARYRELEAERDAANGRVHAAELHAAGMTTQRDCAIRDRDAAIALAEQRMHGWVDEGKEKDALAARLAPVEDEELVEICAKGIASSKTNGYEAWMQESRAAIAAIRPHIEAVERERCAKIAETPDLWVTDKPSRGCDDIAAAIRRGK